MVMPEPAPVACRALTFIKHSKLTANKLQRFGGHAAAAGFAADASLIPEIIAHLETQMSWSSLGANVDERIVRTADAEISPSQLGYSLWEFVDKMAPFGTGNPEPLFLLRNAQTANINYMGRNQDHVRLTLQDDTGRYFRAVGFGMADALPPDAHRRRRRQSENRLLPRQTPPRTPLTRYRRQRLNPWLRNKHGFSICYILVVQVVLPSE